MPTFDIYHKGSQIASKDFNESFLIVADLSERLFWIADDEEERRGNVMVVWVQPKIKLPNLTLVGYQLLSLMPDWQLTLDGVQLPKQLHELVDLTGKHVSLQYGDYEFVCQFPAFD